MLYTTPFFAVYFGDAIDELYPQDYLALAGAKDVATREPYARACHQLGVDMITFCHQVHGIDGYVVTRADPVDPLPFTRLGDFLVTNQHIALGVMTADCLPIVLYDTKTQSVGVVHAGWRGVLAGVTLQAIMSMERNFGTQRADLQVIFGPAARVCCYEVTAEFKEHLQKYDWCDLVLQQRGASLFFDLTLCNVLLLQQYGIDPTAIITDYNCCTVCSANHCSYRRDKERAGRQMTVVARI